MSALLGFCTPVIGDATRLHRRTRRAHLPGYGGTLWEGGIALAAGTQLIAATPGISLGCEFYMPHHVLTEDVLEAPIANRNGHVIVPTGAGLGITVTPYTLKTNAKILAQA